MSKIQVSCPACHRKLKVSPEVLGKKVRCPGCKEVVRLTTTEPLDAGSAVRAPANEQRATDEEPAAAAVSEPATRPAPADSGAASGEQLPSNEPSGQEPVVPMAKLIQPAAASPSGALANPGNAPGNVSSGETDIQIGEKPRVKFKRKRSNPWPTILLAVVALTVLGIAVTFIAIMQGGASQSAATDLPTIRYVNDANVELGQTASIPIKVDYPDWMTMEQSRKWNVEIGESSPAGVEYNKETETMTWTPGFRDAGKTGVIEAVVQHPETGKSNVARFQVIVAAIPLGSQQVHEKVEQLANAGRQALLGSPRPVAGSLGLYHDLELDGTSIRAYVHGDPVSAAAAADALKQADPQSVVESLTVPLEIRVAESVVLVGNKEQVQQNVDLSAWFDIEGNQLPGEPGGEAESAEMSGEQPEPNQ